MHCRILVRIVTSLCFSILVAVPAHAQTSNRTYTFGAVYDLIFHVPDNTSSVGAHFDVASEVMQLTSSNIQAVGEIGFNHFEGGTYSSFMGGGRWAGRVDKAKPFFQFVLGINHVPEFTDFAFQPGLGVDYDWSPKLTVRAQLDFRRVFADFESYSATRFGIGVVIPFSTR